MTQRMQLERLVIRQRKIVRKIRTLKMKIRKLQQEKNGN